MTRRAKIIGGVIAAIIVFSIIGAVSGGDKKEPAASTPAKPTTPKPTTADPAEKNVAGTMSPSIFLTGDKEAIRLLRTSDVFCRWDGDEVRIGATFRNGLAAHITVHIQPNYRLQRAGLHGDGLGSQKDIGLDGDETRVWSEKIGKPDGVSGRPRITECAPELTLVELG